MPQRQSAGSAATRTRGRGTAASGGFSISHGPTTRPDRRSDFMRRCRKDPFDRFRNHPDFNSSPDNGHHDLGTRMFFQRDADLRVTTQESREAVGKKGMGCMRIGPQADMAPDSLCVRRKVGMHLFELGENLSRMTKQRLPCAGELDASRLAKQQRCADRRFQQTDAMTRRGGCQMHPLGAPGQITQLGNGHKKPEVDQVIRHSVG